MSKPFPSRIQLKEFQDEWPKDASGLRARSLMLSFLGSVLVDKCAGATGLADIAQTEVGDQKSVAKIFQHVESITAPKADAKVITVGKPLRRFASETQPKPTEQKS